MGKNASGASSSQDGFSVHHHGRSVQNKRRVRSNLDFGLWQHAPVTPIVLQKKIHFCVCHPAVLRGHLSCFFSSPQWITVAGAKASSRKQSGYSPSQWTNHGWIIMLKVQIGIESILWGMHEEHASVEPLFVFVLHSIPFVSRPNMQSATDCGSFISFRISWY